MERDNFFYETKEGKLIEAPSEKSSSSENIKHAIAEKLDHLASEISTKADTPGVQPTVADYGKDVSHLLERSAEYVRNFHYEELQENIQNYVAKKPGVSLLLAGTAGFLIGAILRRR
jgi:hypothetical protein